MELIANNVITDDEADQIDYLSMSYDRMREVLRIVKTSLKRKLPTKYKGLLKSMEESSDFKLKEYAKKLGELKSNISYKIYPADGRQFQGPWKFQWKIDVT